jgi:hypothetical protein
MAQGILDTNENPRCTRKMNEKPQASRDSAGYDACKLGGNTYVTLHFLPSNIGGGRGYRSSF